MSDYWDDWESYPAATTHHTPRNAHLHGPQNGLRTSKNKHSTTPIPHGTLCWLPKSPLVEGVSDGKLGHFVIVVDGLGKSATDLGFAHDVFVVLITSFGGIPRERKFTGTALDNQLDKTIRIESLWSAVYGLDLNSYEYSHHEETVRFQHTIANSRWVFISRPSYVDVEMFSLPQSALEIKPAKLTQQSLEALYRKMGGYWRNGIDGYHVQDGIDKIWTPVRGITTPLLANNWYDDKVYTCDHTQTTGFNEGSSVTTFPALTSNRSANIRSTNSTWQTHNPYNRSHVSPSYQSMQNAPLDNDLYDTSYTSWEYQPYIDTWPARHPQNQGQSSIPSASSVHHAEWKGGPNQPSLSMLLDPGQALAGKNVPRALLNWAILVAIFKSGITMGSMGISLAVILWVSIPWHTFTVLETILLVEICKSGYYIAAFLITIGFTCWFKWGHVIGI